jgi:hypothetical protein
MVKASGRYVETALGPTLKPGDVGHGQSRLAQQQACATATRAVGAKLFFLSKYSAPELSNNSSPISQTQDTIRPGFVPL